MIIGINFNSENWIEFKTLEDVEEASITPCIWNKKQLQISSYGTSSPYLEKLLNRSVKCDAARCWLSLYRNVKAFNACEVTGYDANAVANVYSKNVLGSMISVVEEPLVSDITSFRFARTSPYVNRIQLKIHQIYDSGLINIWLKNHDDNQMTYVKRMLKNTVKKTDTRSDSSHGFDRNIFILFLIGCSVSIAVLFCEIFYNFINEKLDNYIYNLFFT